MEGQLAAAHGVVDALVALQIPLDQLDLVEHVVEVPALAGGEVVENAHRVPVGQQSADQMRADEAPSAGHESNGPRPWHPP